MRYGFVIDNRKCIGCHSCTVACKTENHVALGANRTWVKYVEKGRYPNTRRFFQVNRCNHCENPPCVAICPVNAMYKSHNGIIDFNSDRCIGCRACMQACPYDAIFVDPVRNTASKCNFCAHRVEVGLEPICAAVCPEHAIIAGDLDDRSSEIGQLLERQTVRTRKPEQGTGPKVYYIEAEESAIVPTAARHERFYMFAERQTEAQGNRALYLADNPYLQRNALVAYDVAHQRAWGWQVPVFFWLKSIVAGLLAVPAIAMAIGRLPVHRMRDTTLAFLALAVFAVSVLVVISDLGRKERFLKILLTPQSRSWLGRGTFILAGYGLACASFWFSGVMGWRRLEEVFLWPTVLMGILVAVYSASLLGQCEGCDLWQTPLLPLHLIVQAILSGGALLAIIPVGMGGGSAETRSVAVAAIGGGLLLHMLILLGQLGMPLSTHNASYAARLITQGPYRIPFWVGAIGVGIILPAALLVVGFASVGVVALSGLLALVGLFAYGWCFVMAGQRVPNS
jgi:Fe-S-cluster-containing dehydrogenase component/formate-dependent nitrite reductase membrane component NrfD